jgi:hypothetical protein
MGAQVNQVGTKTPSEHKDPEDSKSHSTIEPADEIEQVKIDEGKTVNIGKAIQGATRERLVNFLRLHKVVFTGSPSDISGIPREISEHKLYIIQNAKLLRQKKKNMGFERQKVVRLEVAKLLKADFIREVKCPNWLSNTVLVKNSN